MAKTHVNTIPNSAVRFLFSAFIISLILFQIGCDNRPLYLNVPYVSTPDFVVDRMLSMAEVDSGDYVVDLGSGDGRIVIAAAKLGAAGHGIDIDPNRVEEARENAAEAGVTDQVLFLRENIFRTDFSQASVVTMFLLSSINEQLRPKLLENLRPGSKVVSHKFGMGEWSPDEHVWLRGPAGNDYEVYLWIIPADVDGNWTGDIGGLAVDIQITQKFQDLRLHWQIGGDSLRIDQVSLRGNQIAFGGASDRRTYHFSGRVHHEKVTGYVQIHQQSGSTVKELDLTRADDA